MRLVRVEDDVPVDLSLKAVPDSCPDDLSSLSCVMAGTGDDCDGPITTWWWNPFDDSVTGTCTKHAGIVESTPFGSMWTKFFSPEELAIVKVQNS